jgi:hypothetical protein
MIIAVGVGIGFNRKLPSSSSPYTYVSSGLIYYRKGMIDEFYVIEYSSDGGSTWLEIAALDPLEDILVINIDDGVAGYRQVVRDGLLRIDHVLTPTGFAGVKDTDWEEVENY